MEWYKDASHFRARLLGAGNLHKLSLQSGVPRRTLRRWADKHGIAPTIEADENVVTAILPEHPKRDTRRTPEQAITDHGYDPEHWDVANLTDNYYRGNDGNGPAILTQSKVVLRRKIPAEVEMPPRTDAPLRSVKKARKVTKKKPLLLGLAADQHCPHQDPNLESCWLSWCSDNQPDKIYLLGDIANLSKPHAKHRQNLHAMHNDEPEECFHEAVAWIRRTIEAAPNSELHFIAGNHDLRCQIAVMERMPEWYNTRRPGEEYPHWDLMYWLALDKLGVTYHRAVGEYHSVEIDIAPNWRGAHGAKGGQYGGAPKDQSRHEGSRATGHAHKGSITITVRFRNGAPVQHVALSVPTMARRDLGYFPDPDSHQGFASLAVHSNDAVNAELALFDDQRKLLTWRDQMYEAS